MRRSFTLKFTCLLIILFWGHTQFFAYTSDYLPDSVSDDKKSEFRIKAPLQSNDTTANKTAYMALDFSKASGKVIIPWTSLERFVKDNPASVSWAAEECCQKCGERIILIHYSSPEDSWKNLAGRDGILSVCPRCMKQLDFFLIKMN